MKVKIVRLTPDVELPQYHSTHAAAFDIAANESLRIKPGEVRAVKTGLIIQAPKGHFLLLASRSSLGIKKGLKMVNGIGIIDRDYSGPEDEIHLLIHNFSKKTITITKGERLAQGTFTKIERVTWDERKTIRKQSRGGIGSTKGYR